MTLLATFQEFGLEPKRKTEHEWAASCPECGGKDRCILWPDNTTGTGGRFHCRQCGITGDQIDFLRKFCGMSYQEASEKAGKTKGSLAGRENSHNKPNQTISSLARIKQPDFPSEKWINAGNSFLASCQTDKALLSSEAITKISVERFIPPDCARMFGIGWHERDEYVNRSEWGLSGDSPLKLPAGIVIATRRKCGTVCLTIRRIGHNEPKYWQVAGSAKDVPYLPKFEAGKPIILLESALDAALLCLEHEAGGICNAVALGGTCKRIDPDTMAFIKAAPLIIASPDRDEAGNKASDNWQQLFPSAWKYRAIGAKDIGEMHQLAMKINGQRLPTAGEWAAHVIEYCRQKRS